MAFSYSALTVALFLCSFYVSTYALEEECKCNNQPCIDRGYEFCYEASIDDYTNKCELKCRKEGDCLDHSCECSNRKCLQLYGINSTCYTAFCDNGICNVACNNDVAECKCSTKECKGKGYEVCIKAEFNNETAVCDYKCQKEGDCIDKKCTCNAQECSEQGKRCCGTYCYDGECMSKCCHLPTTKAPTTPVPFNPPSSPENCTCDNEYCVEHGYNVCESAEYANGTCSYTCGKKGDCLNKNCTCSDDECINLGFDSCSGTICINEICYIQCCKQCDSTTQTTAIITKTTTLKPKPVDPTPTGSLQQCVCDNFTCIERGYEYCVDAFLDANGVCDYSCIKVDDCPQKNCTCEDQQCVELGFQYCETAYCQDGRCELSCCNDTATPHPQEPTLPTPCDCTEQMVKQCFDEGYTYCVHGELIDAVCKPICRGPHCANGTQCVCEDKECGNLGYDHCGGTYCENNECKISCCVKNGAEQNFTMPPVTTRHPFTTTSHLTRRTRTPKPKKTTTETTTTTTLSTTTTTTVTPAGDLPPGK
ncbi:unnamed protein product [Bursaphelenchus okinawaensis]|uniref:Uncharacterized protein n=1 Tax=Bursaphelenchus okinawaensis TaxID=465554 RepID=A0A811KAT9_9BILA|nr:unnamed protein product [Bursaphelenchus okinawaensis]CAG9096344.1 unnamed protein product [Bursaphelenchus okinawaensis]